MQRGLPRLGGLFRLTARGAIDLASIRLLFLAYRLHESFSWQQAG